MPARLDHIGVAVKADTKLVELLQILGLDIGGSEVVDSEQVKVDWVKLPEPSPKIELLQSSSGSGPIAKFLEKQNKDAIHHLCFSVDDIKAVGEKISAAGFQFIYPEPKMGAGNCLVNFVHPKTTGGLLIELSQKC